MGVEIVGLARINARLEKLARADGVTKAVEDGCLKVETTAKTKAPKDSGALSRSITSEVKASARSGTIEGTVYTPLEYAPYIEYGTGLFSTKGGRRDVPWRYQDDEGNWHTTSGQPPQPFMRTSLDENRAEIVRAIKEALKA